VALGLAFSRVHQPNVCQMPKRHSEPARVAIHKKTGFRPGGSGACEARLFLFTGQPEGEGEPPIRLVAACDLPEAMLYIQKWHADLDILRVEFVALIEMLSGSPLN
jgi:hypothetical protein